MSSIRLSDQEVQIIKKTVHSIFGEAKIFLFGSRTDPAKKGGDIDLFIIPKNQENLLHKRLLTAAKLEEALYKPVDIVIHKDFSRYIEQEALKGIEL